MRGALPEAVLRRAKSPLTGDPQWEGAQRFGIAPLVPAAGLEKYVDFIRVPDRVGHDMMLFWVDLRLRALNYWLRNLQYARAPGGGDYDAAGSNVLGSWIADPAVKWK